MNKFVSRIISLVAALSIIAPVSFAPSTALADTTASIPFSDGFGTSNDNDIVNWENGNPEEIAGTTTGDDTVRTGAPGSSNNKFAKLGCDDITFPFTTNCNSFGWMYRTLNATGLQNLVLKYYYKGDLNAESSDKGFVQYCIGSTCSSFTDLVAGGHALNLAGWSSQQTINLPAGVNNSTFRIRFLNGANQSDEDFRIDDVTVTGTVIPVVNQCSDGLDNDSDGATDYPADPGCTSASDNDESGLSPENTITRCTDGLDNDGDGNIDLLNPNYEPSCSAFFPHVALSLNIVGGSATAADFQLTLDGGAGSYTEPGPNDITVYPGSHTGSATFVVPNYTVTDCTVTSSVTDPFGNDACVVTVTYNAPEPTTGTLTIVKHVTSGSGNFDFNVLDNSEAIVLSSNISASAEEDGSTAAISLTAGTYGVYETYEFGWLFDGATCMNESEESVGTATEAGIYGIEIGVGDNVTCTFTNTPNTNLSHLIINKETNLVDDMTEFGFTVTDGDDYEHAFTLNNVETEDIALPAGTYTITEGDNLPGWYLNDISCVMGDDTIGSGDGHSKTVTFDGGTTVTCTFMNTIDSEGGNGHLIVKKQIVGASDDVTPIDFSFSLGYESLYSFEDDGQNELTIPTGTYTVTEPSYEAFTTTYSNNVNGEADCANLEVTEAGVTPVCTITNTYNGGESGGGGDDEVHTRLRIYKLTPNYFGKFNFTVTGADESVENFSIKTNSAGDSDSELLEVEPGTYTIKEELMDGWTLGGEGGEVLCEYENDSETPDFYINNGGSVTLDSGDEIVCRFVNTMTGGLITITKHVINDNGQSDEADNFTIQIIRNGEVLSEVIGDEEGVTIPLSYGEFEVVEDEHGHYTTEYSGQCSGVMGDEMHPYCTVTNDDISGGHGSGHNPGNDNGSVLGASIDTETNGQVLGASCPLPSFAELIMIQDGNGGATKETIAAVQEWLNSHENAGLTVTGVYDQPTKFAIMLFQEKYSNTLAPWGIQKATGHIWLTTANMLRIVAGCGGYDLQADDLFPFSA